MTICPLGTVSVKQRSARIPHTPPLMGAPNVYTHYGYYTHCNALTFPANLFNVCELKYELNVTNYVGKYDR